MTHKQSGFTLLELLTVLAVLAALTAIATPVFSSWLPNYRLRSAAREIYSCFQRARMEAVRRNRTVVVRFDEAHGTYEVFVDTSENGTREAGESLLAQVALPEDVRFEHIGFSSGVPAPGYTGRGLPWKSRIGHVQIKSSRGRSCKIILSIAGNLRMEQ